MSSYVVPGAHGLRKGDELPSNTPRRVWLSLGLRFFATTATVTAAAATTTVAGLEIINGGSRAVLTSGHVPKGPWIFFLFEGPPTGCGEINLVKLNILLPLQTPTVRETR